MPCCPHAGGARVPLSVAPAVLPAPGPPSRADAAPQPFFASRASRASTAAAPAASVAAAAAEPVGAARAPVGAPSGESAPAFQAPAVVAPPYVPPLAPAAAPQALAAPRDRGTADGVFLVQLDSVRTPAPGNKGTCSCCPRLHGLALPVSTMQ